MDDNSLPRPHTARKADLTNEVQVPSFLWQFANDHAMLNEAASDLRRFLLDIAGSASISVHTIEARAKSLSSYQEKSEKVTRKGVRKYSDPGAQITDCIAARVILFTSRARSDIASLIDQQTVVKERHNPGETKHNGYDSEHFIITSLRNETDRVRFTALNNYLAKYPGLEVQLRSVAGHAWAEYEHDVRYKPGAYSELAENQRLLIDQKFIEAGGMRRVMDDLFNEIQDILYPSIAEEPSEEQPADLSEDLGADDVEEDQGGGDACTADTLRDFSMQRHPDLKPGPTAYFEEIRLQLASLGINDIASLSKALSAIESDEIFHLMDYPKPPTCARRLDDELLAAFGFRYIEVATDAARVNILRLRLRRVRGKFAIYSIVEKGVATRPMPAARAVRDLASIVAREAGIDAATIPEATSRTRSGLTPSSHPRVVKTPEGDLYVATNLSRRWAERIMKDLVASVENYDVHILRAGDELI